MHLARNTSGLSSGLAGRHRRRRRSSWPPGADVLHASASTFSLRRADEGSFEVMNLGGGSPQSGSGSGRGRGPRVFPVGGTSYHSHNETRSGGGVGLRYPAQAMDLASVLGAGGAAAAEGRRELRRCLAAEVPPDVSMLLSVCLPDQVTVAQAHELVPRCESYFLQSDSVRLVPGLVLMKA